MWIAIHAPCVFVHEGEVSGLSWKYVPMWGAPCLVFLAPPGEISSCGVLHDSPSSAGIDHLSILDKHQGRYALDLEA